MWLFKFYRFYISILSGVLIYLFVMKNIWLSILSIFVVRLIWFSIDIYLKRYFINRDFNAHIHKFKQQNGPYGIRIANKAENDWRIKENLAEVFTPNIKKLKKSIDLLETMDELFKAGLSPQGDEHLLHDLRLKYGRYRLEKNRSS